eukprot:CAMPEP_0119466888 /NCGR_PEP_ID=MMETSP1344-20130328/1335_1 /TAXON_ID=236787 /ORGANISM="Florenciella parvula, Strain CCMP2471" /LENGTH=243 /DNA_ID=CAMNT_0007499227 /DNA_START=303 /DNA_END=1030 /DNA_ORIENTATION=+
MAAALTAHDREAFHAFNLYDHDGDGYITQDEMKRYLVWSMRATGVKDVQEAAHQATINCFRTSDRNQDGLLSFDEFKRWYHASMRDQGAPSRGPGRGGTSFTIRVPTATFCYLHNMGPDGKPNNRTVNSLDPAVKAFYKNVFVGYELKMRDGAREWSVMKRYSSIRSFVQALKKHNGYTIAATFPPKVIGKVNIDDRRLGLEWYLRALLREPSLRNQEPVQRFLNETDADMTEPNGPNGGALG